MVAGFTRSISLPLSARPKGCKTYHARSASLPCRSHPIISHLEEQIRTVRSWAAKQEHSPACIEAGLAQIELLQTSIDKLLHLPTTQETLRRAASTDGLLDNFLHLADSYGSILSTIMALKQQQSEIQSAFRRCDKAQIASSLRSQRRIEKELGQLASTLRGVAKCKNPELATDAIEAEITMILTEAINAIGMASETVFIGFAAVSAAASAAVFRSALSAKSSGVIGTFRKLALNSTSDKSASEEEKEMIAFQRLAELEESVANVESGSERVFRSLVNSRVSLLNISTPSF